MKISGSTTLFLFTIILLTSCREIFRKDQSLTPAQYAEQGMPVWNKTWTEQDFTRANLALGSIRMKNFYSLPRKSSSRSAPMFNRMISKENFAFLDDTGIPLSDKAYRIQTLGNFMGQLGTFYNDKLNANQYYGDELIEIYATHIFVRGRMLELAENINNSTRPEDIAMQSGRNGIVGSYVFLMAFLVSEEQKPKAYSSGQLKRLNKEIAHSLSNNIKYLDSVSKQKISAEIRKLYEINKSGSGRKEVDEMLKFLSE
jgi:hypothetical protein